MVADGRLEEGKEGAGHRVQHGGKRQFRNASGRLCTLADSTFFAILLSRSQSPARQEGSQIPAGVGGNHCRTFSRELGSQ